MRTKRRNEIAAVAQYLPYLVQKSSTRQSIDVTNDGIKHHLKLFPTSNNTRTKRYITISPPCLLMMQSRQYAKPVSPSSSHNAICFASTTSLYALTFFSSNSPVDSIFRCLGTNTASWPVIRRPSARSNFAPNANLLMSSFFSVETM